MKAAFGIVLIAAAAAAVAVNGQTAQCHYDCYNFKGSVADAQSLKTTAVSSCLANNVAGNPPAMVFASGPSYFQTNAKTAPGEGCTVSVCTPFTSGGYTPTFSSCEHATNAYKALTAPANLTSNAARVNANLACTACPAAS